MTPAFESFRGRIWIGLFLFAGLFGGIGSWAVFAELSGAVIAGGTVEVAENIKEVQHRDGGIVSVIEVAEGDVVAQGDVLFRLDDAQSRAEQSILKAQLAEATARRARLLADRDGLDEVVFPTHFNVADPAVADLIAGELRLHAGNIANRANQTRQLQLGIEQVGEEISGLEAQRAALVDEVALVEEGLARAVQLSEQGLMETSKLEGIKRDAVQIRGRLGELDANIARSRAKISEVEMQILSIGETARTEAQRELAVIDGRIAEVNERLMAVGDRLTRTDIRAPIAGRINELAVTTQGGVISPAQILATVVPLDAKLNIEVRLPVTAIDQVTIGQEARLRFSAFNHRTTPELRGEIAQIAPATSIDQATGQPYYAARVEIPEDERAKLDGLELLPGMPVEVYIQTRSQTALAFLVRPISDQIARTFREE